MGFRGREGKTKEGVSETFRDKYRGNRDSQCID
jgi:hypothetical protein